MADSTQRRRRLALIPLAVLLIFAGIPAARILFGSEPEQESAPAPPVVAELPERGRAAVVLQYPGTLLADATVTVLPRVAGQVVAVEIDPNEVVERNQVIARIDSEVLELQAQQARAAWEAAEAQWRQTQSGARATELAIAEASVEQAEDSLETARANLERTERLYEAGTVSRSDIEEARDRFSSASTEAQNARRRLDLLREGATDDQRSAARSQADAARRQFELAELQLSRSLVRTPVAGRVARLMVEEGDTVGLSSPVAAVINDSIIRAEVDVPERHYGRFFGRESDVSVEVRPSAWDETFSGRVTRVATVVDAASRTFSVEVSIDNSDGRLRPGMYVVTDFIVEESADAILLPRGAVVMRDGESVVYVLESVQGEDAVVREVAVDERTVAGDRLHIAGGLSGSEQVVVAGNSFLEDGQAVRIVAGEDS